MKSITTDMWLWGVSIFLIFKNYMGKVNKSHCKKVATTLVVNDYFCSYEAMFFNAVRYTGLFTFKIFLKV